MKVGRQSSSKIMFFSNSQPTYHESDLPALVSSCHIKKCPIIKGDLGIIYALC